MNASNVYRVGELRRISHTVYVPEGRQVTSATVTVYGPDRIIVTDGAPCVVRPNDASTEVLIYYVWDTTARPTGMYTYHLLYAVDDETAGARGVFWLLPPVSRFDRWVERVQNLWLEERLSEETNLLTYPMVLQAVDSALDAYSRAHPHVVTETIDVSDDPSVVEFDLPDGWETGFSRILRIEYPVEEDRTTEDLTFLPVTAWSVDEALGAFRISTGCTLGSATAMRVYYTIRHYVRDDDGLVEGADTVPDAAFDSVTRYAAAEALTMLAGSVIRTNAPAEGADTINYRTKTQEYAAVANRLREQAIAAWGGTRNIVAGGMPF